MALAGIVALTIGAANSGEISERSLFARMAHAQWRHVLQAMSQLVAALVLGVSFSSAAYGGLAILHVAVALLFAVLTITAGLDIRERYSVLFLPLRIHEVESDLDKLRAEIRRPGRAAVRKGAVPGEDDAILGLWPAAKVCSAVGTATTALAIGVMLMFGMEIPESGQEGFTFISLVVMLWVTQICLFASLGLACFCSALFPKKSRARRMMAAAWALLYAGMFGFPIFFTAWGNGPPLSFC